LPPTSTTSEIAGLDGSRAARFVRGPQREEADRAVPPEIDRAVDPIGHVAGLDAPQITPAESAKLSEDVVVAVRQRLGRIASYGEGYNWQAATEQSGYGEGVVHVPRGRSRRIVGGDEEHST